MNASDTRERLLDAAQQLFVERGITTEAGANLASVNYHFGTKDELIRAVFARHLTPLNQERIRLLNDLENKSGPNALPLEAILNAFLKPTFEMRQNPKSREFVCLLGRVLTESNDLKVIILQQFREVQQRYFSALQRTLPDLPLIDLTWRVHFLIGAMAHTLALPDQITPPCSTEKFATTDTNLMQRLIDFTAAGLRAPSSSNPNGADR
jgi:AcrR family transcriptional regulator